MTVQAKFFVSKITRHDNAPTADKIEMGVVCRGRENAEWASATPWGNLTMGVLNDKATEQFEEGEEYLVTFTKVEKPQPGDGHQPQPAPSWGALDSECEYTVCRFCGIGAKKYDDGTLDWSAHTEHYGAP